MPDRITVNENGAKSNVTVRLKNVRLSFPKLFKPERFDENDPDSKPTYGSAFILQKEGDEFKNAKFVQKAIKEMLRLCNEGKKLAPEKLCLRDGEHKEDTDGYGPDVWSINSNSTKPVAVVDKDLSHLTEESGKPYAGCYVNATINLWWQDHPKYGKRVNAALRAVQFAADGEPFGEGSVDPESEFDDISGVGDDDSGEDWL